MFKLKKYLLWDNLHCIVRRDCHDGKVMAHVHDDFYEMVVVREGYARHFQNDCAVPVGSGAVLLIRPGEEHWYERANNLNIYNILFAGDFLEFFKHDLSGTENYQLLFGLAGKDEVLPVLTLRDNLLTKVVGLLEIILEEEEQDKPGSRTAVQSAMLQVMLLICRYADMNESFSYRSSHALRISRMMAVLEEDFAEEWDLDKMAKRVGISQSSFRQQFVRLTGIAPMRYLLNLRLDKAASLLLLSDKNIGEIALYCGFADSNYFSRAFREKFSQSPREYRCS